MPSGVYKRTEKHLKKLTEQILKVTPEQLKGVSHGGLTKGSEAWKQMMRECRLRYSRTPKGRFQHLYSSAKRLGRDMDLTLEDLTSIQKLGECFYCSGKLPVSGHGLDRLDNSKGYTKDNVAPCCKYCNQKKGRLEQMGFKYPRTVELIKELMACSTLD